MDDLGYSLFLEELDQLASPREMPDWGLDRQERSRLTRVRILTAARRRLEQGHRLDRISVHDLAHDAGVSVGALYARFPSKHGVLTWLGMADRLELERYFLLSLDGVPSDVPGPFLARFVASLVTHTARNRSVLRELACVGPMLEVAPLFARLRLKAFAPVRDRLEALATLAAHPDPRAAVEYALFLADAAVSAALLVEWPGPVAGLAPGDEGTLVRELTRTLTAYLS
jgi:AcrR family transcriptional regulator